MIHGQHIFWDNNIFTIINPMDENPISPKNSDNHSQYTHVGISFTGKKSIGMVLRVVNGEVLYSDTTNRMIICYDDLPLMD